MIVTTILRFFMILFDRLTLLSLFLYYYYCCFLVSSWTPRIVTLKALHVRCLLNIVYAIRRVILTLLGLTGVLTDYACVCINTMEAEIYSSPDDHSLIGFLFELDCKPKADWADEGIYVAIMNEQKVIWFCDIPLNLAFQF